VGVNPVLILGLLLVVLGVVIVLYNANKPKSAFPTNTSDLFWNVVFEWRWRPIENRFEIVKESIKKYCPNCHEDLLSKYEGGYYFLFCDSCKFISQEYFQDENGAEDWNGDILKRELEKIALKNG